MSRIVLSRRVEASVAGRRRFAPRVAAAVALLAGLAATGVSADTLAQPKQTDSLERAAAKYIRFREDVAAIEAMPFNNKDVTREAHRRLAAHGPRDLSGGWVAYAALVAAETPEFAEALKEASKTKPNRKKGIIGGREGLVADISRDPKFVRTLPGSDAAIASVLAMTARDGARITSLGESFKSQAYAMQKTAWGKARISSSQERLLEAANFRKGRGAPAAPAMERVDNDGVIAPVLASVQGEWASDWGGTDAPLGDVGEANADAIMDRILNLAARYSTNSLNPKIVEVYAKNNKSKQCLEMSKLTLDQCIAATRTPYEEAFCLGEHGLNDIASCQGWVGVADAS